MFSERQWTSLSVTKGNRSNALMETVRDDANEC